MLVYTTIWMSVESHICFVCGYIRLLPRAVVLCNGQARQEGFHDG